MLCIVQSLTSKYLQLEVDAMSTDWLEANQNGSGVYATRYDRSLSSISISLLVIGVNRTNLTIVDYTLKNNI